MAVPKRIATQLINQFKRLTLLHWLLLVTFFNALIFTAIVPVWHTPDEQAHFAQVQYIAEFGRNWPFDNKALNLSQEVLLSEQLLGTERNEFGRNKFTLHPEYRIDYTDTLVGKYEEAIKTIPQAARTTLVKREATRYPVLYYYLAAGFYRLGHPLDLFNRVMLARLSSVLMGVAMVYISFKLAQLVFPRKPLAAATAATLVSFQPMLSFLSAGVTSDNLMNLLFTWFLYLCALAVVKKKFTFKYDLILIAAILMKVNVIYIGLLYLVAFILVKKRPTLKHHLLLGLSIVALKLTKPHYIISLPILLSLTWFFPKKLFAFLRRHGLLVTGFIVVLIWIWRYLALPIPAPEVGLVKALQNPTFQFTLKEHLTWTLRHTVAEVIPWYWGVFNWLGVALPRTANRIINRILIIAAVGLGIWAVGLVRRRKLRTPEKITLFLASSSVIFFSVLMLWDWLFRRNYNFSFGMQGRYYFPTLTAHMILIVVGLNTLIPSVYRRLRQNWLKLIGLLTVVLNFVGLYTVAKSYYQLTSLRTFLTQASQYKPIYFKSPWLLVWFALYALSLVGWAVRYLLYANRQRSRP